MSRAQKLLLVLFAACCILLMPTVYVLVAPRLWAFAADRWHRLSWAELTSAAVAFSGALIALGAMNRMSRDTEKTIALSFATVGAGLLGFMITTLWPGKWSPACDLLLVGGITALLIGSRKRTLVIEPRWMPVLSALTSIVTWGAFFWAV